MKKKILIMESEKTAIEILSFVLQREGYSVIQAGDGLTGLDLAKQHRPDLIILDLLPSMDNAEICQCLREEGISEPILVFTDHRDKMDKATYTELGASDYIDQPFAMSEFLMRVKINTLNSENTLLTLAHKSKRQFLGRVTIDFTNSVIFKDDAPLNLTTQEYNLVRYLASDPGQIFSRMEILKAVWNYAGYSERHVDVTVRRLRLKIEDDPANPSIIMSKRGKGYFFHYDN